MAQLFSQVAFARDKQSFMNSLKFSRARRGFTLIEVLVAMTITLLIMGTIVTVFNQIGTSVADSRAGIEMSDQVQGVRDRLQRDLGTITVQTKPWLRLDSGAGYFELIEGPRSDLIQTDAPGSATITTNNATDIPENTMPVGSRVPRTALGDFDDVLMFTSSDPDLPFLGRGFRTIFPAAATVPSDPNDTLEVAMIESHDAEIIWFAVEHPVANSGDVNYAGEPGFRTIYRRAILVAPGMPIPGMPNIADPDGDADYEIQVDGVDIRPHRLTMREWYEVFDVSVRRQGDFWVPNSLADLTWRQNRFGHEANFPHQVDLNRIRPYNGATNLISPIGPLMLGKRGQDIMLRNALAFDVRVYDPQAPLKLTLEGVVVAPGEPGWINTGDPTDDGAVGAFVDLNYHSYTGVASSNSWFAGPSQHVLPRLGVGVGLFAGQWDTWPFAYEQDGIDQDANGLIDEGTNGYDEANIADLPSDPVVDNPEERETRPPYIAPLRGVLVRIRAYEPYSRQVRDVSLVENFVGK